MNLLKIKLWASLVTIMMGISANKQEPLKKTQLDTSSTTQRSNQLYQKAIKLLSSKNNQKNKYFYEPLVNEELNDQNILSHSVKLIQNAIGLAFNKNDKNDNNNNNNFKDKDEEEIIKDPILIEALNLLKESSELNNVEAIYTLGNMNLFSIYQHPRNITKALSYFQKLADINGDPEAQHLIAIILATGLGGVEKDPGMSILYHSFASRSGYHGSRLALGYRYLNGISVPKSCPRALSLYYQAAQYSIEEYMSGPPGGKTLNKKPVALADFEGGVFGNQLSPGQGKGRQAHLQELEETIEFYKFKASDGDFKATVLLGKSYYDGQKLLDRSYNKAYKFLSEAIGLIEGLGPKEGWTPEDKLLVGTTYGLLGKMYLRGEGVKSDNQTAFNYFEKGNKNRDKESTYWLGRMYMDKKGDLEAQEKGLKLYINAMTLKSTPAFTQTGLYYLNNNQPTEAYDLLFKAMKDGDVLATYHLAKLYAQGTVVPESCPFAAALYKLVAERLNWGFDHSAKAYEHVKKGEMDSAMVHYIVAAEMGIEVAQQNVAWLIDLAKYKLPSINKPINYDPNYQLALAYWTRSANQDNSDSRVKQGDYYYLGQGTNQSDYSKAAGCYQHAAEKHLDSLAMWNLGWMHENGIGVVKDYHLAKRWYDESLTKNSEAVLPVTLSLLKLRLKQTYDLTLKYLNNEPNLSIYDIVYTLVTFTLPPKSNEDDKLKHDKIIEEEKQKDEKVKEEEEEDILSRQSWRWSDSHLNSDSEYDAMDDDSMDNYIILALCLFVGWLVYVRQFGNNNDNNNQNNNNNNNNNNNIQIDQNNVNNRNDQNNINNQLPAYQPPNP